MNMPTIHRTQLSLAIAALSIGATATSAMAQTSAPAPAASSPSSVATGTAPAQVTASSDANPAAASAAPASAPVAEQKAPTAAAENDVQSVVVTATRRAERLQDVSLAVTAVKAEDLQAKGIKDLVSITQSVPGLDYAEGNNTPGFKVRGIGSFVSTEYFTNAELPVGVVVDGVVQGLGSSLSNLGEVERVEILKGPQGTQFGKNAAAGVINITTIRPEFSGIGGEIYGSYGNLNQYEARGAVNVPLSSTVAFRASVFTSGYDGYIKNLASGEMIGGDKQQGGSIKFLFKPTKDLDFFLSADGSSDKRVGGSNSLVTINSLGAYPTAPAGVTPGLKNLDSADLASLIGEQTVSRSGVSLEANLHLADYTLTSVTAFRQRKSRDWGGGSAGLETFAPGSLPAFVTPNLFTSDSRRQSEQRTEELRVTSPKSDAFEYVAGYLFYDQPTLNKEFGGFFLPTPVDGSNWLINPQHGVAQVDTTVKSNALFGDGKVNLTKQFSILMGLRYTHDKVDAAFTNPVYTDSPLGSAYTTGGSVNPPLFGAPGGTTSPPSSTAVHASKVTYKIGSEYKIDRNAMFFGTYSTGYLGPVINYKFDGTPDTLKPQTNANLTLGFKTQFIDRRLTLNADLFQDRYHDLQTGFFSSQLLEFIGENAPSATTKGLEIESSYRSTFGTTFGANLAYVHATFGDYCSNQANGAAGVTPCTTPSGAAGGQLAGYALNNVPKLTATLSISHTMEVGNGYTLTTGGDYYYRTAVRARPADPLTQTPANGVFGLNGRVGPDSGNWHVGFYGRNVFNKIAPQVDASGQGAYYVNYTTRDNLRAYGVSFDANY